MTLSEVSQRAFSLSPQGHKEVIWVQSKMAVICKWRRERVEWNPSSRISILDFPASRTKWMLLKPLKRWYLIMLSQADIHYPTFLIAIKRNIPLYINKMYFLCTYHVLTLYFCFYCLQPRKKERGEQRFLSCSPLNLQHIE